MANNFAFIEKTLPGRVDEVYVKESVTQRLLNQSGMELDFSDAKKVKVFKTTATGTRTYKRGGHGNGANGEGESQSTLQEFEIKQERWFSLPFDKLDNFENGETVFGHQTQNYVKEHLIPETDTYRLAKLADMCSVTLGNKVVESTASITNTILAKFTAAFKWMAERKVPEKKQVIYVNPDVMEAIRTSTELVRYLSQSEYKGDVNFTIEKFMGREIVEVPSDMFFTNAIYLDDVGVVPTANSKKINYLICDASATIPVERLNWSKVYSSDETDLGYVGYKYDGLINHDIFVLDNKKVGFYCSVSDVGATGGASVLLADVIAATTQSKSIINKYVVTSPATILWDAIGLYTTNGTAPAIGTSFSDKSVAEYGNNGDITWKEFTPNSSHNILVATKSGKVVAVSKDFTNTLPVGA